MSYLAVNWLAVFAAMIASMALGVAWYMGLSRQWMAAAGVTPEHVNSPDKSPYIWSAVVQLVMAYFIALLTPALFGATTVGNAMLCGLHMWLGFGITAMILNHRYQGRPWALTVIDGGYLLGVLLIQGVVIGLFG
jgi:dipeptide/tripeptide permease